MVTTKIKMMDTLSSTIIDAYNNDDLNKIYDEFNTNDITTLLTKIAIKSSEFCKHFIGVDVEDEDISTFAHTVDITKNHVYYLHEAVNAIAEHSNIFLYPVKFENNDGHEIFRLCESPTYRSPIGAEVVTSKKYEMIKDNGRYRIKALRNFADIETGDIGGFVYSSTNLSHTGDCWIYDDAFVTDHAIVSGNAKIRGSAIIKHDAIVTDNAVVCDDAVITGHSNVSGNAKICDSAHIEDHAQVYDNAVVRGEVKATDDAHVYENAEICGVCKIADTAHVHGNTKLDGNITVADHADIATKYTIYSDKHLEINGLLNIY